MAKEDWSNIPADVLSLIVQELPAADRSRFRSVCLDWNSTPSTLIPHPLEIPWLLIPESEDISFYSTSEDKTYRLAAGHLTDIAANLRLIISYSGGWLMYMDKVCELHCVHLGTGSRIITPSITSLPNITGVHSDDEGKITGYYMPHLVSCDRLDLYYKRGIIIFNGSSRDNLPTSFPSKRKKNLPNSEYSHRKSGARCTAVFAVFGLTSGLLYAKEVEELWTDIAAEPPMMFVETLLMHNGSLFVACTHMQKIYCIEFNDDLSIRSVESMAPHPPDLYSKLSVLKSVDEFALYLADIDDNLCLIWRGLRFLVLESEVKEDGAEEDVHNMMHETCFFLVYKFDEWKTKLSEMKSLGDNILFLGSNISMSLPAHRFSQLDKDSIYFTDDIYIGADRPWWDRGMFNLQDHSMCLYRVALTPDCLPQPTWVTPFSLHDDWQ